MVQKPYGAQMGEVGPHLPQMVPMWFAKMGPIMTTLMAQLPPIWAPFVLLAGTVLHEF
jgi:hypothetical protein